MNITHVAFVNSPRHEGVINGPFDDPFKAKQPLILEKYMHLTCVHTLRVICYCNFEQAGIPNIQQAVPISTNVNKCTSLEILCVVKIYLLFKTYLARKRP